MAEILNNVYIVSAEILDGRGHLLEKFTTLSYAGHLLGYTMGFNDHGMVYSVNTLFPSVYKHGTRKFDMITIHVSAIDLTGVMI